MRIKENPVSSSNLGSDVKFSQKMELNSSNFKASYLANPIQEDEYNKSVLSSSQLSSNMSSEISRSNSISPTPNERKEFNKKINIKKIK